jgi:hypothetical protein
MLREEKVSGPRVWQGAYCPFSQTMFTVYGTLNILISQKQVQRGLVYIAIRPALPWEGPDLLNRLKLKVRRYYKVQELTSFHRRHVQVERAVGQNIVDLFYLLPGYFNVFLFAHGNHRMFIPSTDFTF